VIVYSGFVLSGLVTRELVLVIDTEKDVRFAFRWEVSMVLGFAFLGSGEVHIRDCRCEGCRVIHVWINYFVRDLQYGPGVGIGQNGSFLSTRNPVTKSWRAGLASFCFGFTSTQKKITLISSHSASLQPNLPPSLTFQHPLRALILHN